MNSSKSPDIIVCGGSAVGAAVAYYLSKRRLRVLIVESHSGMVYLTQVTGIAIIPVWTYELPP